MDAAVVAFGDDVVVVTRDRCRASVRPGRDEVRAVNGIDGDSREIVRADVDRVDALLGTAAEVAERQLRLVVGRDAL